MVGTVLNSRFFSGYGTGSRGRVGTVLVEEVGYGTGSRS